MIILRQSSFSDTQPLKFKDPESPKMRSPYESPGNYSNWKGDAEKYYKGSTYYNAQVEEPEPEEESWDNEEDYTEDYENEE